MILKNGCFLELLWVRWIMIMDLFFEKLGMCIEKYVSIV